MAVRWQIRERDGTRSNACSWLRSPRTGGRFWKSLWVRESRRSEHRPGVWGDFEEMGESGVKAVGGSKAAWVCAEGVSEVGC